MYILDDFEARINRGRRDISNGTFSSRPSASKIWLCLFGPISQPQPSENEHSSLFSHENRHIHITEEALRSLHMFLTVHHFIP